MDNKLLTKLDERANNSDKEFLGGLVKELVKAKETLSASELPGIPPTVRNDLYDAIEDAIAQSTIVIFTGREGNCDLSPEDLRALHS